MKKSILFSVIIPTYNREEKLKKAIESVVSQNYKNWEIVVVDNFSKDNTKRLVQSYNNHKIKFFTISNKGIIAKSRNKGILLSKGEWIAFLDSDDWWDKDKLRQVTLAAEKGYLFIYHGHYVYAPNRLISKRKIISRSYNKPVFKNLIKYGPTFANSSVVVEKNIFEKVNCFDEDKNYIAWEDWDAWLRVSNITDSFYKIDKILSTILVDGNNFLDSNLAIKNMDSFFKKYIKPDQITPEWCLYNLLSYEFKLKNYKRAKEILKKVNFFKLNNFQKINYIKINLITYFDKYKSNQ